MKRLLPALFFAFAITVSAQDHAPAEGASSGHATHPGLGKWKWANFAILVVALGYLAGKTAPAFFRGRTEEIQRGIAEAKRLKQEADAQAAQVEKRMARLEQEIEQIRQDSGKEMSKERERILSEAERGMARVQAQAEQEIGAISKQAALELKAYAAQLAIRLAGERIRERMNGDVEAHLVERFILQMDRQAGEARL